MNVIPKFLIACLIMLGPAACMAQTDSVCHSGFAAPDSIPSVADDGRISHSVSPFAPLLISSSFFNLLFPAL